MTPADLQTFLHTHAIVGELLFLDVPTPTVETAAQAVGAHPDQIVKSVLFLIDGNPVLAVACGLTPIERRPIADRCQVGRKRVKLANAETVLKFTGYPAGAVPPFGHPQPLPTLVDPGILQYDQVYAGGGAGNALVCLHPREILRVTGAELVQLIGNGEGKA